MPPGEKLMVTLMAERGAQVVVHTFMLKDDIRARIEGEGEYGNSQYIRLEGMSPIDEPCEVNLVRQHFIGYVIAPYLERRVAESHQASRRLVQ